MQSAIEHVRLVRAVLHAAASDVAWQEVAVEVDRLDVAKPKMFHHGGSTPEALALRAARDQAHKDNMRVARQRQLAASESDTD